MQEIERKARPGCPPPRKDIINYNKLKKIRILSPLKQHFYKYKMLAESSLFGFAQNRMYQNGFNFDPVKQNFDLYSKLENKSLISEVVKSGKSLGMEFSEVKGLLTIHNASSVANDVILTRLSENAELRENVAEKNKNRKFKLFSFRSFLCRTVR
jgi:hypothetical protein